MNFDFEFAGVVFMEAVTKVPLTLVIAFGSLAIGAILGLFVALLRFFNVPLVGSIFRWVVTFFKGTPIVLFLTIIYMVTAYGFDPMMQTLHLPFSFREFNKAWVGVAALGFLSTIAFSEAFRGAMASVGIEQYEAAYSVGETKTQALIHIVLPQALAISLPMASNITIGMTKGISLLSLISVIEVLNAAQIVASKTYQYFEAYVVAALIYWAICIVIEQVFGLAERHLGKRTREV
jgi:L-cystine transport system permease protein